MPREIRFDFPLPNGLHARPASDVQELTSRFASKIQLANARNQLVANAKSVLSMVSADVRKGDPCTFTISGADEERAEAEFLRFVRDVLPHVDDEAAASEPRRDETPLPRSLTAAGLQEYYRGTPVSGGIGWGKVVRRAQARVERDSPAVHVTADEIDAERSRFLAARTAVHQSIDARIAQSKHLDEIGVLRAHRSILDDEAFLEHVDETMRRDGVSASSAVRAGGEHFGQRLRGSESAYLRERALDLQDVADQLLDALDGRATGERRELSEPSIVVADRLTPSEFLALDRDRLRGLVLREAGTTSHTVILARSSGVPTLVGVAEIARLRDGQDVIVDANVGVVVPNATESVRRYYEREQRTLAAFEIRQRESDDAPLPIAIGANVSSAEEAELAIARYRADGVGLFRTEMLFIDRDAPPGEDEQFEIYARAARAMNGQTLTVRLLDIGGDKPVGYLDLPQETNPFLGYRGVRVYERHRGLIETQVRAIARAREAGEIRILVPMVSSVDEMQRVRAMAPADIALGAMIETPACAFMMSELAEVCDFFSIGSNDLAQYFLAADRDNANVAHIYGWSHPSFLRMMSKIVARARSAGKPIGLCGEMADDPRAWPILLALKLDQISVPGPRIGAARRAIRAMRFAECDELLQRVLACATRADADKLLDAFRPAGASKPLLDRALVLESSAPDKPEVIKEIADAMWLAGRASSSHRVEAAIWAREDTYSTGFGHGFALPHCKSDDVSANSIAIAKLSQPIDWGSNDGQPVDVVICVAMRASEYGKEHLKVFAQLSRMVMRDEFRDQIRATTSTDGLLSLLKLKLE